MKIPTAPTEPSGRLEGRAQRPVNPCPARAAAIRLASARALPRAAACGVLSIVAAAALASPASAQLPDLRVATVDDALVFGNWQSLKIGGTLAVVVENSGTGAALAPFDLVVYGDENGNEVYEPGVDLLLGSSALGGLAAGTQQGLSIPLAGRVRFREDRIFAVVDTADAVPEGDEGNNQRDSGADCRIFPAPGAINPVIEWAWTSSGVEPASLNVMSTPVVLDLDLDGAPEIVFGSTDSTGGGLVEVGMLRALSGATGAEVWNVTDPLLRVNTAFNAAGGDIDGDGFPEIVTSDESGLQLLCFEHDGTFKWRSAVLESLEWGSVSLADLDADGSPEIVVGRQVLDAAGNLLWTGTQGSANPQSGALSIVADFDLDGAPDVIAGNTVYRADGTILCSNLGLNDAYVAVANFDADAEPELVHVSQGEVRLLERDSATPGLLAVVWGPVALTGGGSGGPPTVADFDGDGWPEIGVACAASYDVLEHDGSLKWTSPTQDGSSMVTGSSVFDFNGDGAAEVLYRDELVLRVFEGATGAVLFQTPMSSCTWHEYVLVADVDADGNAEIVACANNNCSFGPQQGIYVLRDQFDAWVPTRRVWNQYAYHITNVAENGAIPALEPANWLFPAAHPFNNYRQNELNPLAPNAAPDLTASRLVATPAGAADTLIVRVGNGGASLVGAGIPISFYDGDPTSGGVLLGTAATSAPLLPGGFEDVSLFVGVAPATAFAWADDAGAGAGIEMECDETNNVHGVVIDVTPPTVFCTAKTNSLGCLPAIESSGAPSASATSGFTVIGRQVRNRKPGLLLYGVSGPDAQPFQSGFLCVHPPIRRAIGVNSGGTPLPTNDCSGEYATDMNAFAAGELGGNPLAALTVPGVIVCCQYWGRDPGFPAPDNSTLTDALSYVVWP